MICAHCGEETTAQPCAVCGAEPVLDGRYRLEAMVGQGASACTYRATDPDGNTVAIKELPLRRARSDKALELFRREARVLRQLDHPAIPRWIEDFVDGEGKQQALYIVQEFIDGPSLADELDDHRYDANEVLDIIDEMAGVLDYLHNRSPPVIHRDIKPDNVLRRVADGRLMLIDFGSVRDCLKHPDFGGSTVTGTFGYMAPEQYQGDATPRSDLYGLGALGVTLLSRRPPHTMLDLHRKMHFRDHVRGAPPVLKLLDDLLEVDPICRLSSAAAVQQAVDTARGLVPIGDPPPNPSTLPGLTTRHATGAKRGPFWRILAPIVAVAGIVLWAKWEPSSDSDTPDPGPPEVTQSTAGSKPPPVKPRPADNEVTMLQPSEVPPRIRLHHNINDDKDVRECFRHHGAGSAQPVEIALSVTPPNVISSVSVHTSAHTTPRLVRCLLAAVPPSRTPVPFVRHWEGIIRVVRSDYRGNWTSIRTAPSSKPAMAAIQEATQGARDRCITATQETKPPRHIGAQFKFGDNGAVTDLEIFPSTLRASPRAACLQDALRGVQIPSEIRSATRVEVVDIWWWWEGAAPNPGANP